MPLAPITRQKKTKMGVLRMGSGSLARASYLKLTQFRARAGTSRGVVFPALAVWLKKAWVYRHYALYRSSKIQLVPVGRDSFEAPTAHARRRRQLYMVRRRSISPPLVGKGFLGIANNDCSFMVDNERQFDGNFVTRPRGIYQIDNRRRRHFDGKHTCPVTRQLANT